MNQELKSINEINEKAIRLLSKNIGLTNTLRFINQFSVGYGNYTEDRKELYKNLPIDKIVSGIKQRRTKK
ncbi:MAG: hypothetical protein NTX22_17635 [Ignavibacteriales bacterium]|nr:hypothetical protein [Ignavibacteriales bacterium]